MGCRRRRRTESCFLIDSSSVSTRARASNIFSAQKRITNHETTTAWRADASASTSAKLGPKLSTNTNITTTSSILCLVCGGLCGVCSGLFSHTQYPAHTKPTCARHGARGNLTLPSLSLSLRTRTGRRWKSRAGQASRRTANSTPASSP